MKNKFICIVLCIVLSVVMLAGCGGNDQQGEDAQTKEITVVLKKKMTEENTGIINNTAEIVEVENSENIKDKDSTPNNRVQGEDDMSSANVLIGVKTGAEVMYITLGLVILIVLAVGIYLINKEVLRK